MGTAAHRPLEPAAQEFEPGSEDPRYRAFQTNADGPIAAPEAPYSSL